MKTDVRHATSGFRTDFSPPPRKVSVATVLHPFRGSPADRLEALRRLFAGGADTLDMIILPEAMMQSGREGAARERAVELTGEVRDGLAAVARAHRSYLVAPVLMAEGDTIVNAAVLFDRTGEVVGLYRKLHPVAALGESWLEDGVTPGRDVPVFACDFGRVGFQICWDMSYDDGWAELTRLGAELIALPSASPQTIRPAMHALRGRCYVVTSTPRDNVSVFNPVGMIEAQRTKPGVLVHTLDLTHAVLHWSPTLDEGRALARRYGDRVGYLYSTREDTGLFWSNDPATPIAAMLRELGLETMDEQIERCRQLRSANGSVPDT